MTRLRRLLHVHSDPDYRLVGVNVYYECRCGARRTRRGFSNLMGPVAADWPPLRDRHGFPVNDTGWVAHSTA